MDLNLNPDSSTPNTNSQIYNSYFLNEETTPYNFDSIRFIKYIPNTNYVFTVLYYSSQFKILKFPHNSSTGTFSESTIYTLENGASVANYIYELDTINKMLYILTNENSGDTNFYLFGYSVSSNSVTMTFLKKVLLWSTGTTDKQYPIMKLISNSNFIIIGNSVYAITILKVDITKFDVSIFSTFTGEGYKMMDIYLKELTDNEIDIYLFYNYFDINSIMAFGKSYSCPFYNGKKTNCPTCAYDRCKLNCMYGEITDDDNRRCWRDGDSPLTQAGTKTSCPNEEQVLYNGHCITCATNSTYKEETKCVKSCNLEKYAIDSKNNICIDCFAKNSTYPVNGICSGCPSTLAIDGTNCINCSPSYNLDQKCVSSIPSGYIVKDNGYNMLISCKAANMYNYQSTCVTSCPNNYALNTTTNSCINFSEDIAKFNFNNTIVSTCPDGYGADLKRFCFNCKDKGYKGSYNNSCVYSCAAGLGFNAKSVCIDCKLNSDKAMNLLSNGYCSGICKYNEIYDEQTKSCISCFERNGTYFYNNTCVDKCPNNLGVIEGGCLPCHSLSKYSYLNKCVDSCPVNTVLNENTFNCQLSGLDEITDTSK
jgi:hypothetical protein